MSPLGEHKMSMLKRQVWMADDDEFEDIAKNSQSILKLNAQYENHPYAQEITKECNFCVCIWNIRSRGRGRCKVLFD